VKRALVFGYTGQVGQALAAPLLAAGWKAVAVSRQPREAAPGVLWRQGALPAPVGLDEPYDAIVSLGPLDAFADAMAAATPRAGRVVAIGSTGLHSKAESPDPGERELAARLAAAEASLAATLAPRGIAGVVLRPTLVYGLGLDRSLSPLVDFARKRGWLPLPWRADGLRQPVHVADVAAAVLACLQAPSPLAGSFDLPGGEALPFAAMVRRTLAVHVPGARVVRVPTPVFRLGLAVARNGLGAGVSASGFLARLGRDQVFDAAPAHAAFGYQPRAFTP
jgi:nucleoside-diphosphate-sugar epimerase